MRRVSVVPLLASRLSKTAERACGPCAPWWGRTFTTEEMSDLSLAETRAKMKEQFAKFGGDKYGEGWADLVSIATSILPPARCQPSLFSLALTEEVEQR